MANYMTFMCVEPDEYAGTPIALNLDGYYTFAPAPRLDNVIMVNGGEHYVQGDFSVFKYEVLGGREFGF